MKRRFTGLALLLIVLASGKCHQPKEGQDMFMGNQCWNLSANAEKLPLNDSIINLYELTASVAGAHLALNRAYLDTTPVFISVLMEGGLPEYKRYLHADSAFTIVQQRVPASKKRLSEHLLKKGPNYLYRTIYKHDLTGNLMLVDFLHPDSALVANLYGNEAFFSEKIKCK